MDNYTSMFNLTGKVALITGAGRGIGLEIARGLAAWGAQVVLVDVDETSGIVAEQQVRADGGRAKFLKLDVTSSAEVEHALETVFAHNGRLDIVVNNAGMSARIPAEIYPDDALDKIIELNIKGVFYMMRGAASRWIRLGQPGRIINLASFAGVVADPLSAPYAATKGAVIQLTRTCSVEWAPHNILVNAIGPGYVRTAMTAHTLDQPEAGAIIRAKTALGRPAQPFEIVGAAIYLSSTASSYVTGHVLMVDGGWTSA